jgi:predicted PurR-regulated permease PerM
VKEQAVYPPPITSPYWTARTKRTVAIIAVVVIGLAIWRLNEVLPIVIVSVILAYLLSPVARFIDQRILVFGRFESRPHRTLAVLLTIISVITVFIIVILVVVPVILNQFEEFGQNLPRILGSLSSDIERVLSEPVVIGGEPLMIGGEPFIPLERIQQVLGAQGSGQPMQFDFVGTTQSLFGSLSGPAFSFVGGAFTAVINLVFLLTMTFYLMRDGHLFISRLVEFTPTAYRNDVRRMLYELAQVWSAYLHGQIILGLVMGTVVFTVATLLGVPNPFLLGTLSGLLEFIPNIGPALALFPAALLALSSTSNTLSFLSGVPFAIVVIIVWTALQNIEAIFLVPRIVGGRLNLHPFIVIIAIIGGASLVGALGIILAAPMVASARVLLQYLYGKLTDQNLFPAYPQASANPTLVLPLRRAIDIVSERTQERLRTSRKSRSEEQNG